MKVQEFISKLFLVSILVTTASCSEFFGEGFGRNDENVSPKIRIVDLSGKPKPIKTFVPEGNIQALSEQERSSSYVAQNNPSRTQDAMVPEVPYVAQDDLSTIPTPAYKPNQNAPTNSEVVLSYDMSSDDKALSEEVQYVAKKEKPSSAKKFKFISQEATPQEELEVPQDIEPVKTVIKKSSGSKIFVQVGSFSTKNAAQEVLNRNSGISSGKIQDVDVNGKMIYRALLGPFSNSKNAKQILTKAKNSGYNDAFIAK